MSTEKLCAADNSKKILALVAAQLAVMQAPDTAGSGRAVRKAINGALRERDHLAAALTPRQVSLARMAGGVVARLCGRED
jgi:hypothetical protein